MQDYAFNPVYLRGLGSLTPPPPPPSSVQDLGQPEGLGREPDGFREPEGLGRGQHWATLPRGMVVTNSARGHSWLLAFVSGSKRPNVTIDGYGFSFQKAVNYFASHAGNATVLFTFSNNRGHYLFAYETMNGRHVIKLCTDGLRVVHTPGGRAPWKIVSGQRGMGQVFTQEPASYVGTITPIGPVGQFKNLIPINRPLPESWTWVQVYPHDVGGIAAKTNLGADIASILKSVRANASFYQSHLTTPGVNVWKQFGNYVFFGRSDPTDGAAQTPGEPAGMAIMRYNPSTGTLAIATNESSPVPAAPAGGGSNVVVDVLASASAFPSFQTGSPTGPGLWWNNYSWIFVGNMPQSYPPGGQLSDVGMYGHWVIQSSGGVNVWLWFAARPAALAAQIPAATAYGVFVGGDGVSYAFYGNASQAAVGNSMPAPTAPPPWLAGTAGQWVNPSPSYFVWIPTAAIATTSYTWIWVLLGVAAAGGVGYYLLD